MINLKGLATGIGSLPHKYADDAVEAVFKYLPQIPFWPQLPRRDAREGMLAQFSENLPCIKVTADGVYLDPKNQEKELENFYEAIIANDLGYFKISEDFAAGFYKFCRRLERSDLKGVEFIKGHITGPFTFASGISDEFGVALLHEPIFMQAIVKGLVMKALWQIESLRKFGKKMIIFIDEPYLAGFGSAYTPLNKETAVGVLKELAGGIKSEDVLLGVHCCGNTDWSIFTEAGSIDIINFDAFNFLDKLVLYAGELKGFIERGGILCWGIVPTQEFALQPAESLAGRIIEGITILEKKGIDAAKLSRNLLITPACGLGTMDQAKAEAILKTLSQTSALIRASS